VRTVSRYRYPALESQFASGKLRRDDAPDQGSALRKLRHQRTPVAVVSRQSLDWHLRQTPDAGLAPWRLTVQSAQYHCALPKGTPVDARAVIQALQALKREGALERLLSRYAPP
jgi:ABC-type amino acid transport substrate-binding protein